MDRDRRTFRPVQILVAGKYRTVNTVTGAGKLLMDRWPREDGPARHKAQMTLLDAFNEEKSPEEVSQALLVAASEAGPSFELEPTAVVGHQALIVVFHQGGGLAGGVGITDVRQKPFSRAQALPAPMPFVFLQPVRLSFDTADTDVAIPTTEIGLMAGSVFAGWPGFAPFVFRCGIFNHKTSNCLVGFRFHGAITLRSGSQGLTRKMWTSL
ncbi:hypothetical protein CPY51_09140 [Rhizobium tubonense]|uniref:DUF982 domain-containing protein n=1 Tax=Rhizobium tubonense TaxID=484088 RepID=A0A2W4CQQ1_9HYPH|nr:hypothetical protein CPY51_09140 [Rhizobium tubonense]